MKIRLIGQRNNLGIGTHYAKFADALTRRGLVGDLVEEIDFTDTAAIEQAIQTSQADDVNICFVGANIHEFFKGTNIQWVVFETTVIPENILKNIFAADQVWVPSTWGMKILLEHGVAREKITVVPEGVDADQFYPPALTKPVGQPLKFLFVGKYEQRKSLDELFDAWAQAFGNNSSVELVIKTNYFTHEADRLESMKQRVAQLNLSNLTVIWGEYSKLQMTELYRSADVFVFPTKAEGWGLPIIEAAAMGIPIVTTYYSAPCDFLEPIKSSCVFVDYDLAPVMCPDYQKYYPSATGNWGLWAMPLVDNLAGCLQVARAQHVKLAEEAVKNSEIIRKNWNWTRSVDRALAAMGSIAGF